MVLWWEKKSIGRMRWETERKGDYDTKKGSGKKNRGKQKDDKHGGRRRGKENRVEMKGGDKEAGQTGP